MAYNASSSFMTFLMHSTDGTTYTKLVDIKEFPDLGQDPELLDTTTLTDRQRTGVAGIIGSEALTFTANYDPAQYKTLYTLMGTDKLAASYYAVWFGGTDDGVNEPSPTGSLGKFSFKGQLSVRAAGAGVDEVRDMSITLTMATPIAFEYEETTL